MTNVPTLWDVDGKFLGTVDKAKKVLDVLSDEELELQRELAFIRQRKETLKRVIEGE